MKLPTKPWLVPCIAALLICRCIIRDTVNEIVDVFEKKPDVSRISASLQESMIAGYAAGIVVRTIRGESVDNVGTAAIPSSFPGPFTMTIDLDESRAVPFQHPADGRLLVTGLWDDSSTGVMSIFAVSGDLVAGSIRLSNIGQIPVQCVDTNKSMAVFVEQDINSATDTAVTTPFDDPSLAEKTRWFESTGSFDTSLAVEQAVRVIHIDHGPGAVSYVVWGGGQFAGTRHGDVEVTQFSLLGPGVFPAVCTRNPTAGYALVRDFGAKKDGVLPEMGTAILSFAGSSCSGSVRCVVATGTYVASSGKSLSLGL